MRRMLTAFLSTWLVGSMALIAPPAVVARVAYTIQDLGTLPGDGASVAMGINALGDVVGWSTGSNGTHAFLFTNATGMVALPAVAGRPATSARAINDARVVVGTASMGGTDAGHAVRWQAGTAQDLGTLPGGAISEARDVNAFGAIVGSSSTDGASLLATHAFRWADGTGMVDLTTGFDNGHAEGINDAGQVTGWRNGRAFRITGGTVADLGVPTGFAQSFGTAINATGVVAGHVISPTGNAERIFRYANGMMTLIGGLGEFNRAFGINSAGDVVGQGLPVPGLRQGFLYKEANGMQGLNQLVDPAAGWYILGASGINDAGQIVGWASGPNGQRAIRLTPVGSVSTRPAAPSGLTAAALSAGRIRLAWTDNSTNETGFRVQRARGSDGTFATIANLAANATTFTDTTSKAGTTYRYRVRALNPVGLSPWSDVVKIRARR